VLEGEFGIKFRGYMGICGVTELLLRLGTSCAFYPLDEFLFSCKGFEVHH